MRRTIIGITTYGRNEQNRYSLPAEYVDAIRRAGATAVLLPPGETRVEEWLAVVDGVILAGGGDIDPDHYGGERHETIYSIDAERDGSELAIARRIVDTGLPTLGICRGVQILNVALGGTLHEHVPDVFGDGVAHRLPPREPATHPIHVEAGSALARIVGEVEFDSHSWHHQAVDDVAPALRVSARAPDGVVEAVEMPEHPWLHAVQWHPEIAAHEDPLQQRIFAALVDAAAHRSRGAR
ncbi:MAG TPA: gamma-glutamyl-gamma-aminobutyrate hydrolase family protein [Candidatus Binatia bacterium]|nr:gamma-glutamyl-gamma-aminobutyrate hydrolase family protein [Candidatus Binatia bacterium]